MADLRSQDNGQLSSRLRLDPLRHMRALEAACHDIAIENRPGYDKNGKKAEGFLAVRNMAEWEHNSFFLLRNLQASRSK